MTTETDDKFTQSFQGKDWAEVFVKRVSKKPSIATDVGTMHGWFSNAIMRGHDEADRKNDDKIKKLQELLDVQCTDGNWNFDPYMHGLANGMIICMAILKDQDPEFLQAPKVWSSEIGNKTLKMGELSVAVNPMSKKECTKRGSALNPGRKKL